MNRLIKFLNMNQHKISHFEGNEKMLLIHMANGDTIEFYSEKGMVVHHYKY